MTGDCGNTQKINSHYRNDIICNITQPVPFNKHLLRYVLALIDYEFQRNTLGIFCVHGYTKITMATSKLSHSDIAENSILLGCDTQLGE